MIVRVLEITQVKHRLPQGDPPTSVVGSAIYRRDTFSYMISSRDDMISLC